MNAAKRLTLARFGYLCGFIEHRIISSVRNREENSGERNSRAGECVLAIANFAKDRSHRRDTKIISPSRRFLCVLHVPSW